MKVLFIVKSKAIETLGPQYLAAVVKQCKHDAKICDITEAPIVAVTWKPEVIGYSIMTGDKERFTKLNETLKKQISFTSIVGGPDPSFFPTGYEWADYIVAGEAENFMARFLESDQAFPNIDSYPEPDRTDFKGHRIRDFITSRGCPYNCSYCYNDRWSQLFSEKKVRTRSVRRVIDEIINVNPDFVYFQDSCFGVSPKWLHEFSREYGRFVNIPFQCHMRPVQVNLDTVLLLHDANCVSIRIAVETANKRLLNLLNRGNTNLDHIIDASRLFRKWNIRLMLQNMIGLPTGTIEDDLQTLEFNIRCKPSYGWCSIFQPYPGTELGDQCKRDGLYKGDYSEITDCFFDGSVLDFSDEYKEQLQCLQKIFALSVETGIMPKVEELTLERFPHMVHRITRRVGDARIFPNIL